MSTHDEAAAINKQHWEKMVRERCGYTIPWLDLDVGLIHQYAKGQLDPVPEPLLAIYPPSVLLDIEGKDVLCLAAGGGQQSAVFALLGARVTVVDLVEGQLEGDRKAATRYGYKVTTIQADMRDLSRLEDNSFDTVYGTGMTWVPDIRPVYSEVARVLRADGIYRVDFNNPALDFVEWDGQAYRITRPYSARVNRREDGAIEFRHYMNEVFNGLLSDGFFIQQVHEMPYYLQDTQGTPGSWTHQQTYVAGGFIIIARKK